MLIVKVFGTEFACYRYINLISFNPKITLIYCTMDKDLHQCVFIFDIALYKGVLYQLKP